MLNTQVRNASKRFARADLREVQAKGAANTAPTLSVALSRSFCHFSPFFQGGKRGQRFRHSIHVAGRAPGNAASSIPIKRPCWKTHPASDVSRRNRYVLTS